MYDRPAPQGQALLCALGDDGRLGYTELAAVTGMGEHTARRRLQRMMRDGDMTIRCDLTRPLAGLPTAMIYRTSVPRSRQEETGNALARMKEVRARVSVSGPHNLLVMVWLYGLAAVDPFEAMLVDRFPTLEVRDRTVVLHSAKRMGQLLDVQGRATGCVPFALPLP